MNEDIYSMVDPSDLVCDKITSDSIYIGTAVRADLNSCSVRTDNKIDTITSWSDNKTYPATNWNYDNIKSACKDSVNNTNVLKRKMLI